MRHVIVSRVTAALTVLFLAAALLFSRLTTPRGATTAADAAVQTDGARLFDTHCGSCHDANDLRPGLQNATVGQRHALEDFLTGHGEAAQEDDRLILDYLAGKNSRPPH
jgi:mono/diheme cytochrome c family protein